MNIDNLSLAEVADVLDAWSETEERKVPYLSGVDKEHARNCAINFPWLRDQIRNRIQDHGEPLCYTFGRPSRVVPSGTKPTVVLVRAKTVESSDGLREEK
jgi:hypothetical protein